MEEARVAQLLPSGTPIRVDAPGYTSWEAEVYVPAEIRIYDEVEKGNQTLVVIRETDLRPLDANIFTKAWLESKSR